MEIDFEKFMEQKYVEFGYTDMDLMWDWLNGLPMENVISYCNEFSRMVLKQSATAVMV